MADEELQQREYWLKLYFLLDCIRLELRQLLLDKWKTVHGYEFDGSSKCVALLKETFGERYLKSASNSFRQLIEEGDVPNWNLAAIYHVVNAFGNQWLSPDLQQYMLTALKVRNDVVHHAYKAIPQNSRFTQTCQTLTKILVCLNFAKTQVKKEIKPLMHNVPSCSSLQITSAEAIKLKDEGNIAFRKGDYLEAVEIFTNALKLASLREDEKATLFANRSIAFLKLAEKNQDYERQTLAKRARRDAKRAVDVQPMWSKAHCRLAQAYEVLEKFEKAAMKYGEAFNLNPSLNEMRMCRDECRKLIGKPPNRDLCCTKDVHPKSLAAFLNLMDKNNMHTPVARNVLNTYFDEVCQKGNPTDEVWQGHRHRFGWNTPVNYELAVKHYSFAAIEVHAEGMYSLAVLTKNGEGVKKDYQLAFQLLKQLTGMPQFCSVEVPNEGILEALHTIGNMHVEGIGVDSSPLKAFEAYKLAADWGFGPSAHNVACMYKTGQGVPGKDMGKAVTYWTVAAHCNVPGAACSLKRHALESDYNAQAQEFMRVAVEPEDEMSPEFRKASKQEEDRMLNDLQIEQWEKQGKRWDLRGRMPYQDRITRYYETKSPNLYEMAETLRSTYLLNASASASPSERLEAIKYDPAVIEVIEKYAWKGRVYAHSVLKAVRSFSIAMLLLDRFDARKEEIVVDAVICNLAACFEAADRVAHFSEYWRAVVEKLLKKKLALLKGQICIMDRYTRQCWAYLKLDSFKENCAFLEECIAKYPDVPYFYCYLSSVHNSVHQFQKGAEIVQKALKLFPNNYLLLYNKAAAGRQLGRQYSEIVKDYELFFHFAPKDYRLVPEAYYSLALLSLEVRDDVGSKCNLEQANTYYQKGLKSEKLLLPRFDPYDETLDLKTVVESFLRLHQQKRCPGRNLRSMSSPPIEHGESVKAKRIRLTAPSRVQMIVQHRAFLRNEFTHIQIMTFTSATPFVQVAPRAMVDLKPITLAQMNRKTDKVFKGYVIQVVVIEDGLEPNDMPSVSVILEDEEKEIQRGAFYNTQNDPRLKYGAKVSIMNPYWRMAVDGKAIIRVDDPKSIFFHDEDLSDRCRYCGDRGATFRCSACQKAKYCHKECQRQDWTLLKHKLICLPQNLR